MSRARLTLIALGMAVAVPALTGANLPPVTAPIPNRRVRRRPLGVAMTALLVLLAVVIFASPAVATTAGLTGTWRSVPEETPLTSTFDESVWGKNARAVRTVEMTITPTGDATLTVTRKVLDARQREIRAATSIEHAELSIGSVQHTIDVRSDHAVAVKHAERRYPDDPKGTWALDGLRVTVSTFSGDPSRIEVRVDTPEGRGSFWETLRRGTRKSS